MDNEPKETTKLAIAAPSLFTLGNLACGFFSILAATRGNYAQAGWLILIAAVFDMFDGRVARLLGAESEFGIEMDSLADAISFCAAPAFLMYFMVLHTQPIWGAPIACVYTCFG
ncbi:MAG: CDP-alcohol phosphatidyltransferase family protein, partial [Elusimicrobiaceae bacterium]|nr:CDP-alcohol phosphatidyltransferase family protein [Elusimicrobiaceae bacterium]